MNPKYKHISLPSKLADAIDGYIKDNPKLDFRSRTEVIKFALRKIFLDKKKQ